MENLRLWNGCVTFKQPPRKLLLVMRFSILFLFGVLFQLSAATLGQQKVEIRQTRITFKEVLEEIERQTGIITVFSNDEMDMDKVVKLKPGKAELTEVYQMMLEGTNLEYRVVDDYVVIKPRSSQLQVLETQENMQEIKKMLRGQVVDAETNEPLVGVNVYVKGTTLGTITDVYGEFNLEVPVEVQTIVFSFIGFVTQELPIADQIAFMVALKSDMSGLDEVVVVGYGKQTKKSITGSIATVDDKVLATKSDVNVIDALVASTPGLEIIRSSGGPQGEVKLMIRGINTFNGINSDDAEPLIVIDGIPGRNINLIDPSEIESVSVLKDAASAAVYGARGGNGVILITTKRGVPSKTKFSVEGNYMIKTPKRYMKQVNSYDYASLWNAAYKNEGTYAPQNGKGYTDEELEKFRTGSDPYLYPNTNWYDLCMEDYAASTQTKISARGGNEKISYFLNGAFVNEDSYVKSVDNKRYSFRSNVDYQISDHLKLSVNLSFTNNQLKTMPYYETDYLIQYVILAPPVDAPMYEGGRYAYIESARGNPLAWVRGDNGFRKKETNQFNSNFNFTYDVTQIKGLQLKAIYALDKTYYKSQDWEIALPYYDMLGNGDIVRNNRASVDNYRQKSNTDYSREIAEFGFNYDRELNDHAISLMGLYNQTVNKSDYVSAERKIFPVDDLPTMNLGDASTARAYGSYSKSCRQGLVGRLKYNYKTTYFLEFNGRYDGSDQFAEGERWGFFPSIAGAYTISNEDFFKDNIDFIDYLKLKVSYGLLGMDNIGSVQYMTGYGKSGTYEFGGKSFDTYYEKKIANKNVTWAKTKTTNIGVDAAFLKHKLSISGEYYHKSVSDMLVPFTNVAPVIGPSSYLLPKANFGEIEIKGVEFQARYRNSFGKFNYDLTGYISSNKNKVIKYPDNPNMPEEQKLSGKSVRWGAGLGYIAEGIYQSQEEIDNGPTPYYPAKPGDVKLKDVSGDGKITSEDLRVIGDSWPKFTYGFNLNFGFKNWQLATAWMGKAGVEQNYKNVSSAYTSGYGFLSNQHKDYWTPENRDASMPAPRIGPYNQSVLNSTFWIRNASFFKLQNIELAYSVKMMSLQELGVESIRLSASANNVVTFTKLDGIDPEAGSNATSYPLDQFYSFKAIINF